MAQDRANKKAPNAPINPASIHPALTTRPLRQTMRKTVSLILPVLIPSWRFFKAIEPSPRVQWRLSAEGDPDSADWREFRPRPQHVSPFQMLRRLLWNPSWNEALFLVSCAERIAENPTEHSIAEIRRRIWHDIEQLHHDTPGTFMQFRLVFVHIGAAGLTEEVVFLSERLPAQQGHRQ